MFGHHEVSVSIDIHCTFFDVDYLAFYNLSNAPIPCINLDLLADHDTVTVIPEYYFMRPSDWFVGGPYLVIPVVAFDHVVFVT